MLTAVPRGTGSTTEPPGHGSTRTPAATDLYREYHRPLLAIAVRLTGGDRQHAEDVVQETLIRAWSGRDRLDGRASLMPWPATVARRIVIDRRRRREVRPPEAGAGPLENVPVADGVDALLRKVVMAEALGALRGRRRRLTRAGMTVMTVNPDLSRVPPG